MGDRGQSPDQDLRRRGGGCPDRLYAVTVLPFVLVTLLPPTGNALGFAKIFRRPDHMSVRRYLLPTVGIPLLAVGLNLYRMNYTSFADYVTTIAVTVVPVMITAALMLRLRERGRGRAPAAGPATQAR